eukprot:gene32822-42493_t
MICEATLSFGSMTVTRTFIVDGGFTEDLTLEHADIIALGLGDPVGQVPLSFAEHVTVLYDQYRSVSLTLTFSDGTTESAFLTPLVFVAPPTEVPVVNSEKRLIGYRGIHSLGLKQDFKTRRLIRRTRRI